MIRTNYQKNTLDAFYNCVRFSGFQTIDLNKKLELDAIINKFRRKLLWSPVEAYVEPFTHVASRLITSPERFNLNNGDEMIYFYIKMADPNFEYLKYYQKIKNKKLAPQIFISKYGFFDKNIIDYEIRYLDHFAKYLIVDELFKNKLPQSVHRL